MLQYLYKRSLHAVLATFVASILVFVLLHLVPGDPIRVMASPVAKQEDIERLRRKWGLDQPILVQYARWITRVVQGDFGESVRMRVPVADVLWPRYVNTFRLTILSMCIAIVAGVTIGVIASIKRGSAFDTVSMIVAVSGFSVPPFWLGLILILIFAVHLGWLPAIANLRPGLDATAVARMLVLPVAVLTFTVLAHMVRMTRTTVINILTTPAIEMAILKGVGRWRLLIVHALPNALAPIANVVALNLAFLISGIVVIETLFNFAGLGRLMVEAVTTRDIPVVQVCAMIFCSVYVGLNLLADVVAIVANPRLRYSK